MTSLEKIKEYDVSRSSVAQQLAEEAVAIPTSLTNVGSWARGLNNTFLFGFLPDEFIQEADKANKEKNEFLTGGAKSLITSTLGPETIATVENGISTATNGFYHLIAIAMEYVTGSKSDRGELGAALLNSQIESTSASLQVDFARSLNTALTGPGAADMPPSAVVTQAVANAINTAAFGKDTMKQDITASAKTWFNSMVGKKGEAPDPHKMAFGVAAQIYENEYKDCKAYYLNQLSHGGPITEAMQEQAMQKAALVAYKVSGVTAEECMNKTPDAGDHKGLFQVVEAKLKTIREKGPAIGLRTIELSTVTGAEGPANTPSASPSPDTRTPAP